MAAGMHMGGPMKIRCLLVLLFSATLVSTSFGEDVESRLKTLEDTTKAQQQKIEEQQRLIDELKSSLGGASAPGAVDTTSLPMPSEACANRHPGTRGFDCQDDRHLRRFRHDQSVSFH